MKKLLVLIVALAMIASVSAFSGTFDAGWATCNAAGNYGAWDKNPDTCRVAWNGVTQACEMGNSDATFTVGQSGMTTTEISITHLNGVSNQDGFEIWNEDLTPLCTVADVPTTTETWVTDTCNVNLGDVKTLTIHPTATAPWTDCNTWGQVAISTITYEATTNAIPEFGIIAGGIALVGALGIFLYRRK